MTPGAVSFQRERHWCGECRRDRTAIRAVRLSDGWHSDWVCVHDAWPGMSLGPMPYRARPVEPVPTPRLNYCGNCGTGYRSPLATVDGECDECATPEPLAQADLFDPGEGRRTKGAPRVPVRKRKHTNCGAVDPMADCFVCVRAAGHPGVHRSPHGGVTWQEASRSLGICICLDAGAGSNPACDSCAEE